ncbi:MAG: hypothetical protein WC346_15515 [Methanogenium sp.]
MKKIKDTNYMNEFPISASKMLYGVQINEVEINDYKDKNLNENKKFTNLKQNDRI